MISVCLISYNGEKFIHHQIESILTQLGDNDELVISDDGSTDKTIDIIKSFSDSRIKLLHANFNSPTFNMENALKHCRGDYIFMSDQDDIWVQNKVLVSLNYLHRYDYVSSDCFLIDERDNTIGKTRFIEGLGISKNRWKSLFKPTPYQGSCSAFKRAVLDKSLPFPSRLQSHDRWIGFIASFAFKIKFLPDRLIYYRRHGENFSTSSTGQSQNSLITKVKIRVYYIVMLLKRLVF